MSTHSPLFVGIDKFDDIRMIRKIQGDTSLPKISTVTSTTMSTIANDIWEANGKSSPAYTKDTLYPRLQGIMTPWINEGFFSDVIVLVEGDNDRAAIIAYYENHYKHKVESKGISVIHCNEKNNIDRPAIIFKKLGIPTYLIWDSDKNKGGDPSNRIKTNKILLSICDHAEEDYPNTIAESFACFTDDLNKILEDEIGPDYLKFMDDLTQEYSLGSRKNARKNTFLLSKVIEKCIENGRSSVSLNKIVERIHILAEQH